MNILVSGCSFTQWPESPGGPNSCWPRYLGHNVTNVGEPAAGNQYIADSVIRAVNTNRPDMVIVMWTGVSRLDYLTSLEDSAWEQLFDSYGFYRRIPGNKLGYIFSGGQMGTWFKNPVAHKMFYEMYKVSSELSLATLNLQEIIKTQHFLKSKNIPYKFMSYVNYWNNKKDLSPNGDFGIIGMPELDYLINDIDFAQWIFSDSDRNGIYELAKSNKDFQPDGFHPGDNTHRAWADFIISRI
jgi:hypothetical protein